MAVIDRDLRFLEVNEVMAAIHGLPVAAHPGRAISEVAPGLAPAIEPLIRQVFASGAPLLDLEVSGEAPAAPGRRGRWLTSYYPVHSRGFAVLAVEVVARAVSGEPAGDGAAIQQQLEREQARLFAELRALRSDAEELGARLDTLVMTAPVGLAFFDTELRYQIVNEQLAEINGLPVAEHLGRTMREVVPALADTAEPLFRRVLESGEPLRSLALSGETAARPGVVRHWEEHVFPVRLPDGQITGMGVVVIEVTEQVRARQEAEAANHLRDGLIAQLAHDLKSPLTAVKGQAELLLRRLTGADPLSPERLARSLGRIVAAARQMNTQIDQLLDSAQMRAGQPIELQRTPTDLVALARRSVEEHASLTSRHTLLLEAAADLHGVWDAARLERVVDNLLGNAIKYSPDGGPVRVSLRREDGPGEAWAVLAIADEGLGIPADELPLIFEQFRRGTNVADQIRGTGLGLASAHFIISAHGGTIAATSEEGRGSTFTIRLPLPPAH